MTASPPNPAAQAVPREAFTALSNLHQLSLEAFLSRTSDELVFRILNRTASLCPYARAALYSFRNGQPKLEGVSGKSEVNPRAPAPSHTTRLVGALAERREALVVTPEEVADEREAWDGLAAQQTAFSAAWLPIVVDDTLVAGLWLERWSGQPAFEEKDVRLLSSLMVAYGAAWMRIADRRSWQERLRTLFSRARLTGAAVILVLLVLLGRIHLRIVAPCEIIPSDPFVVAAPLDGVLADIAVEPGQYVKKGETLFRYDKRVVLEELNVAHQQVEVIRSDLKRARVLALSDPKSRSELIVLENRLRQEEIRKRLAELKAQKLEIKAARDGVVLIDDPHEWRGRSVTVGQRVLSLVDPAASRALIWLPENDNIEFDENEPVRIFLSVSPDHTREARLVYVSRHIQQTATGVPSFRAEAEWAPGEDVKTLRVGLTGTAMLYGQRVSVAYWLMRKPWATLRRFVGF